VQNYGKPNQSELLVSAFSGVISSAFFILHQDPTLAARQSTFTEPRSLKSETKLGRCQVHSVNLPAVKDLCRSSSLLFLVCNPLNEFLDSTFSDCSCPTEVGNWLENLFTERSKASRLRISPIEVGISQVNALLRKFWLVHELSFYIGPSKTTTETLLF
jgi:hypothetical protein